MFIGLALNNKTKLSFSADYEFISASIGFTSKFFPGNNDDNLKGKSSFTDFNLRFFPGKLIQNLHYRRLKGFYLKNTGDLLPGWQEGRDAYLQFPGFDEPNFWWFDFFCF